MAQAKLQRLCPLSEPQPEVRFDTKLAPVQAGRFSQQPNAPTSKGARPTGPAGLPVSDFLPRPIADSYTLPLKPVVGYLVQALQRALLALDLDSDFAELQSPKECDSAVYLEYI